MLSFQKFDLKTGKTLTDFNEDGTQTPRVVEIAGEYLETWLNANNVEPEGLFVAEHYKGLAPSDRVRREQDGKFLLYTSGKTGYFADEKTAKLVNEGDPERGIEPIYANSRRAAHNAVAYGSLPVSDGEISIQIEGSVKVLVVDNINRSFGTEQLVDRKGEPIPLPEVEDLLDKMGDGTMLTTTAIGRELLLDREILKCIERGISKEPDLELGGIDDWLDLALGGEPDDLALSLLDEFRANGKIQPLQVSAKTAGSINRNITNLAQETLTQFRFATPSLPGIAKGVAGTSKWCERLGVEAIISTDDIKGDDKRLSTPGLQTFDRGLWMNRKGVAEYTTQSIGMQVKGTIPESTLNELNPILLAKSQELAETAASSWLVAENYVAKEDRKQARALNPKEDFAHTIIKADVYNQLTQHPEIAKVLKKSQRSDILDAATSGIEVPAATAQHHSKLEPWEICNRKLPHGAIIAYGRSPLGSIGGVVTGVVNNNVLKEQDSEAYNKRGAVYLNPDTAKKLAITDFDGDRMFLIMGGVDPNLPEQLRAELGQNPATGVARHEIGRAAIEKAIENTPVLEFTQTTTEFIKGNAPECKPLTIAKAEKSDHPWHPEEDRTAATWRAWEVTADNPTGKVANLSMTLQGLAAETHYIPDPEKPRLLQYIGTTFDKIDRSTIPTDEYLAGLGLPELGLKDRIEQVVTAGKTVAMMQGIEQVEFAKTELAFTRKLIQDYTDAPMAQNLQTAVDSLKSSIGIDESLHEFGKMLAYKKHELRKDIDKKDVYLDRPLKTNVRDPIGFAVEAANELFNKSQELALVDKKILSRLKPLIPAIHTPEDAKIVKSLIERYDRALQPLNQIKARLNADKIAPEDLQPTIILTSSSGRVLELQRTLDADPDGESPVWNETDGKSTRDFYITTSPPAAEKKGYTPSVKEKYAVYIQESPDDFRLVGFITDNSAQENNLDKLKILPIEAKKGFLAFQQPTIEFRPPFVAQHDKDRLYHAVNQVLAEFEVAAGDRHAEFASAAWHSQGTTGANAGRSEGMRMAMRQFPQIIASHLDRVPRTITTDLTPVGQNLADGSVINLRYERGYKVSAIAPDGLATEVGSIRFDANVPIAPGTVVEAKIHRTIRKGQKIEVSTSLGVAVVNPDNKAIQNGVIPRMGGTFTFKPDRKNKEIYVFLEQKEGAAVYLGAMGKEISNREVRAQLTEQITLPGAMQREISTETLEIEVLEKIDSHSVAAIDRGELIPVLPVQDRGIETEELCSDQHPVQNIGMEDAPDVVVPTLNELRLLYKNLYDQGDLEVAAVVSELGKTLVGLHEQPWKAPGGYSNPAVTISSEDLKSLMPEIEVITKSPKYSPSISELRQLYLVEAQAMTGSSEERDRIRSLGISLVEKYQGLGKVPDDFSHPDITIEEIDRDKLLTLERAAQSVPELEIAR